ncbi:hypothetical protein LGH83_18825 [Lichenihabitans sp. PAMC28606]|uniref:hypothetical protein n=1 Tax=Lichenihabitans sp. PAMC28606 TaxID=2880932 RepID=UPI001D0A49AC|nr:hypothetical protein [Lichenihabitans sp. PAMC28606]UDL94525.1 hypothetical protein LGH83_18825 [Lichenihabitans sp. PAMC28606]
MAAVCVLAVLIGSALAVWMPAIQFALGLLLATLLGGVVAVTQNFPIATVLFWAALLFVCCQVGYGLGLGVLALTHVKRGRTADDTPSSETEMWPTTLVREVKKGRRRP